MKYLVDTCGWIEWLTNGHLGTAYEPYLIPTSQLVIPTIIQYELFKWISREKSVNLALEVIGITERGSIISLDTDIALYASDFSQQYGLAMADAVIYATSQKHNVLLITSDKHFQNLPQVKFLKKK